MRLRQLERAAGLPSTDVRLIVEIEAKVRQKTKELGLDPSDTTAKELYHALQSLTRLHDGFLLKKINPEFSDSIDFLESIKSRVNELPINRSCWALKQSVARRILKSLPPKQLMKDLGYKSVDSLLKREKIEEIYGLAQVVESNTWHQKLTGSYKKLTASDFEIRDIEVAIPAKKRWAAVANDYVRTTMQPVIEVPELGAIIILPLSIEDYSGLTVTLLALLIHHINEIRLYSAYFKMQQVKPDFGSTFARTIKEGIEKVAEVGGQPVHWRSVHRYYGNALKKSPGILEPHVQLDDLLWQKAEDVLYRIEPALKFWENLDYVGFKADGRPISLNLLDNAISLCNKLPYGKQVTKFLQLNLTHELYTRYLAQEDLEQQVLSQLDEGVKSEIQFGLILEGVV